MKQLQDALTVLEAYKDSLASIASILSPLDTFQTRVNRALAALENENACLVNTCGQVITADAAEALSRELQDVAWDSLVLGSEVLRGLGYEPAYKGGTHMISEVLERLADVHNSLTSAIDNVSEAAKDMREEEEEEGEENEDD